MSRLAACHRIVVKIGSSLLVEGGRLREAWLASVAEDLKALSEKGAELIVVSSGAIALGRGVLGLSPGPLKLEESQAAAAVGQIALAQAWAQARAARGLTTGQVLLTLGDTEERRRYLNARSTLDTLLRLRAVPVINENDTVATTEIRYGDNDRLAARVASMASADGLVLLSDVDGLYTAPPGRDPDARLIPEVEAITPEIEAMAGDAASELSRGGMRTKIEAARIATHAGCAMVIACGRVDHPLRAVQEGASCTWFHAHGTPVAARKRWIAGTLKPHGVIVVDAGAARALRAGSSLLPAGVVSVSGRFSRGDAVVIRDASGRDIARGLAGYDAEEAARIVGCRSDGIEAVLGYSGRAALVHRDDMVLSERVTA